MAYDPKTARRTVRAALRAGYTLADLDAVYALAGDAIRDGREQDADAIVLVARAPRGVLAALIVGRSIITGDEAYEHLVAYHDGDFEQAHIAIDRFAETAAHDLRRLEVAVIVVRDSNERWRAFRDPLPTVDEVRARAVG